jgi:hypothetical protein
MKRRIVMVLLVAFTLWPLAHRTMVATFNINPWKFYGWAMFCVPNPKTKIAAFGIKGEENVPLSPTRADRVDKAAYNFRRGILGSLTSPDDFAQALLRRHPEVDGVGVVVVQYHVDWRTALLVHEREVTVHRRR